MASSLTGKQKAFINHYLECWNGTEAARRAGYSEKTARSMAYENLTKPHIRAEIDRRMKLMVMSADEAMLRLTQEAAASIGDFIDITPTGRWQLNLNKAKEAGLLHLIKEIKFNEYGPVLKLYDAQAAKMFIVKQERGDKLSLQLDEETLRLAEKLGVSADTILEKLAVMIRKQAEAKGLA